MNLERKQIVGTFPNTIFRSVVVAAAGIVVLCHFSYRMTYTSRVVHADKGGEGVGEKRWITVGDIVRGAGSGSGGSNVVGSWINPYRRRG